MSKDPDLADLAARIVAGGGVVPSDVLTLEADEPKKEHKSQSIAGDLFTGDPSLPLPTVAHEQMLHHILAGEPQYIAYQRAGNRQCSRETATQQASRVMSRADVKARLRYLLLRKGVLGADADQDEPITQAEIERILSRAVRSAQNQSDRIQAAKTLQAMRAGRGQARQTPDPAFLAEFLRRAEAQGRDPVVQASMEAEEDAQRAVGDPEAGQVGDDAAAKDE